MRKRFWLTTTLLFVSVMSMVGSAQRASVIGGATVADPICASSSTLESLVDCIRDHMPKAGSNGFVAPNETEQADWRAVVNKMLRGSCEDRKSTRLNSSHLGISYAVFCLKKKN